MNPVAPSGPWSLGVLIGVPAAIIGVLLLVAVGIWFLFQRAKNPTSWSDRDFFLGWGIGFLVAALALVAGACYSLWPFDSAFHQWRSVHGTVQQVSSRLIGTDKSVSQRFVVQIAGQDFGVDDTRASLLHKGDQVSLRCKKDYQYQSVSGWVCNWGG